MQNITITIFTDGASRGNPGPGGWGAIVLDGETAVEIGGREDLTTNNRMELLAVISAIEKMPKEKYMVIYTDSAYVLSGATRWIFGWQNNNWKTSKNEDVLNRDLWGRLLEATRGKTKIDWRLLKGHSGIPANERCDVIATAFADNKPIVLYFGAQSRYGVDTTVKEQKQMLAKPSRVFTYSYVAMVGGIISTYKTWPECRVHVMGVKGAKYKKVRSQEEEEEVILEYQKSLKK